jgi:tetratricopeptide (TPR) repeat protein
MLAEVRIMVEKGNANSARSLLEAMWADFMALGQHELAEQVFYTWLESVDGQTGADEVWPPIMGFLLMKAGKQTWVEAFEHAFEIQKRLIVAGQNFLSVMLAKSVLLLNPPRSVRLRLLVGAGTSLLRTGDLQGSKAMYHHAIDLWKPEDGKTNLGRCYHGVGAAALFENDFQEGLKWTDDALSIYNHLHSDLYFGALQNKGVAIASMSDYTVAEELFSQCEIHWSRLGNHAALDNLHSDLQRLGFLT